MNGTYPGLVIISGVNGARDVIMSRYTLYLLVQCDNNWLFPKKSSKNPASQLIAINVTEGGVRVKWVI